MIPVVHQVLSKRCRHACQRTPEVSSQGISNFFDKVSFDALIYERGIDSTVVFFDTLNRIHRRVGHLWTIVSTNTLNAIQIFQAILNRV